VLVGKNHCGQWVVQHQKGLFGGLFVDRAKAMRFALDENGHQPQSVVVVSDVLEFDMGRRQPRFPSLAANSSVLARVA
jgi:hypothetical protein